MGINTRQLVFSAFMMVTKYSHLLATEIILIVTHLFIKQNLQKNETDSELKRI